MIVDSRRLKILTLDDQLFNSTYNKLIFRSNTITKQECTVGRGKVASIITSLYSGNDYSAAVQVSVHPW